MPLHLNLLHEQLAQRAQRKRDPLKLGLYALCGVAVLFVVYYLVRVGTAASLNSQLVAKRLEYSKKFELPLKNADAREKEFSRTTAAANALTARVENRFYWAPLLDVLLRTVPREVQLLGFCGNDDPKEKTVAFTLEGVAAGREPRAAAEQFRITLANNLNGKFGKDSASVRFRSGALEETRNSVALDGRQQLTARFTIEVTLRKPSAAPPIPAATPIATR
jgi:hypothetical protein